MIRPIRGTQPKMQSAQNTYHGSCHCQAVTFVLSADAPVTQAMSCNCSICRRKGTLLTFVGADAVSVTTGQDALASYQFNQHVISHLFCRHCGVTPLAKGDSPEGESMWAVNVRCIDAIDLEQLDVSHYNGKDA